MSDFPGRAPQISARRPRSQTSQFRAGKIGAAFRFVSSGSRGAKWHEPPLCALSRYNAPEGQSVQGRPCGRFSRHCFCALRSQPAKVMPSPRRTGDGPGHRARQGADGRRRSAHGAMTISTARSASAWRATDRATAPPSPIRILTDAAGHFGNRRLFGDTDTGHERTACARAALARSTIASAIADVTNYFRNAWAMPRHW